MLDIKITHTPIYKLLVSRSESNTNRAFVDRFSKHQTAKIMHRQECIVVL